MTSCKHALLLLAFMAPFIITTHAAVTITWTLQGNSVAGGTSTSTYPGPRYGATSWVDSNGKLWMFSGVGKENNTVEGYLNQLYQYNPSTNVWSLSYGSTTTNQAGTYATVGAAGTPGGRYGTARWSDASGNLYLFGGQGIGSVAGTEGVLNDFWQYRTATAQWIWVGGQSTANAQASANVTTYPSPRVGAAHWTDKSGNFVLFGGKGYSQGTSTTALLNDLWSFNPTTSTWTQITTDTKPTGRSFAASWSDADGNGWVYGGSDLNGVYNSDMWQFRAANNSWAIRSGSTSTNQLPVYPTTSTGNPGGLYASGSWHSKGQSYMFGGYGLTTASTYSSNRDIWAFSSNTSSWTYVYGTPGTTAGSSSNPGARYGAALWQDKAGNIIIFGGNGYDSNGGSTAGILGDTRVILACVFTSSCLLGANGTNTTTTSFSTNNATTTGSLTTGGAATTGGTTTGGTTTTLTATVSMTVGMSGDPAKVNLDQLEGSVATAVGCDPKYVNASIVTNTTKRAVLINFSVLITVFFPNSSAIAAATGGAGGTNVTAQLAALQKVVTSSANSTAVTNTLKAQNLTVTSISATTTSAVVVVPSTTAKSTTVSPTSSTTYSAAPSVRPAFAPLMQVAVTFAACVFALFLCTN